MSVNLSTKEAWYYKTYIHKKVIITLCLGAILRTILKRSTCRIFKNAELNVGSMILVTCINIQTLLLPQGCFDVQHRSLLVHDCSHVGIYVNYETFSYNCKPNLCSASSTHLVLNASSHSSATDNSFQLLIKGAK